MVAVYTPALWAQRQFGRADLGDTRITDRAVLYAAAAAKAPSYSIPHQCGGEWSLIKGAYRLFDNRKVSFAALQASHCDQTRKDAGALKTVLWLHDTTTLSYDHPATVGLGPTSAAGGSGILLQTTLGLDVSDGIDASPFVLGLGHQQPWVRPGKPGGQPVESAKWMLGIQAIATPPAGVRWVHVADSESDCWHAIEACNEQNAGFALRACQNRQVLAGHLGQGRSPPADQITLLFDLLEKQPTLGTKKLWVRGRKDRAARWAKLVISAMALTLLAPRHWSEKPHRKDQPQPQPQRCWAVRVREIDGPDTEDPIEWVILTDEPVSDRAAALKVVYWYSCRWLIEEYHKCLKTGCAMEDRQLERAVRLENLLAILAVVAVRLLQLKHQARTNPDAAADSIVPRRYVDTLSAHLKRRKKLTIYEFFRETARLGGFIGRKNDGEPGWITLWRGWQHLEILADGVELAKRLE